MFKPERLCYSFAMRPSGPTKEFRENKGLEKRKPQAGKPRVLGDR
jgi:hypothetical protein